MTDCLIKEDLYEKKNLNRILKHKKGSAKISIAKKINLINAI